MSLIDLRDYINTSSEDFYTLPNLEGMLRINTKGVLDTVRFENKRLRLSESNVLILATEGEKVQLRGDGKTIAEFTSESYVFNTLSEEQSSTLQKAKRSVSEQILQQPYIIIGFMLCLYIIFLSFQRIPKDVFFRAVAFLVLSGVMAYPFMSSWFTPDDSILLSVNSLQVLR